jgi:hypothetical protein
VRVNGDDADGALALQRSQSFNHAAGRQAETWRTGGFDRDQVSVLGIGRCASRDRELLAEHFLVDGLQPAAAMRDLTEDAQYAVLGMVDDLDDPTAMTNTAIFVGFFNSEKHAVTESGSFAGVRFAWGGDADLGRRSVCVLVPFVRRGDEITIAVASGHIREHGGGQGPRMMQLLPPLLDGAFVGQFAKHPFEVGAQRVF